MCLSDVPTNITVSPISCTYTGQPIKPSVVIKDKDGNVLSADNYTLVYKNNVNVGMGSIFITFKGKYNGIRTTRGFWIEPKTTNITNVTAKTGEAFIEWQEQSNQTKGYQIEYSPNSDFIDFKTDIKTVDSNQVTSVTIPNLDSGREYYFRIRTYAVVKVDGKEEELYSQWSESKHATIQ